MTANDVHEGQLQDRPDEHFGDGEDRDDDEVAGDALADLHAGTKGGGEPDRRRGLAPRASAVHGWRRSTEPAGRHPGPSQQTPRSPGARSFPGSGHDAHVVVRRDVVVAGLRITARTPRLPPPVGAPAVVLVHGLGMSGRSMLPTLHRLAPAFRVWAPDLPGFGDSARPRRAMNMAELADVLAGWMDAVDLPRAALLGNSLGCQVIGHLATRSPTRLTRAVLVGPTGDPQARNPVRQAGRLLLDAPREAPSLIPLAMFDYLRAGPARMWRTLRDALDTRAEQYAPHVRVPVLVVRGQHDPIVAQRWAQQLTDLLPNGHLLVVPHAAHAVNYSAPAALADAVRPFLDADRGLVTGDAGGG